MKTTVVTGLLGSGKTTFIKTLVQSAAETTVVLVNDFGEAGIDGEIFSAGGIESVELSSGCVCCTLKFDLITTITRVINEFSPQHLVIEPSGVASPSGVLEALQSSGIRRYTVISIVDVTEFAELYQSGMYGSFFREQIVLSDVILINKKDLADDRKISEAEKLIESINPRAILFRTKNGVIPYSLPLEERGTRHPPRQGEGQRVGMGLGNAERILPLPLAEKIEVRGKASHLQFETLSLNLSEKTRLAFFQTFFNALVKGRYGSVARAKALLATDKGPYRFDGVYGKTSMVPFEQEIKDSRLVVIGEELDRQAIEKALATRSSTG